MSSTEEPIELFVISDLHVGGAYAGEPNERGFRINRNVNVVVQFINEVGQRALTARRRTELVINGDFVDFLAEEVPTEARHRSFISDPSEAVATFDAVVHRDLSLFTALRQLLEMGVAVTIVLGNHDIELSLPMVRARLESLLAVKDARGFRFVYDGEAYVVGDVLIEHGNRYDGWNVVDYDRLRRFRSESSRRLEISADARFFPPAGSELVQRVMNPIKEDYPFIDLLKPETDAALPLLIALEPDLADVANSIEALRLQRQSEGHAPRAPARPAQAGDIAGKAKPGERLAVLKNALARRMKESSQSELLQLIDETQNQSRAQQGEIAASTASRIFSFMRLRTSASLDSRLRILLGSLRALQDDQSFNWSTESQKDYLDAANELAAKGFATVVFGHTHLAKEQSLACGGTYLNTGTWADLIRIPDEIIRGDPVCAFEQLKQFAKAISDQRFDKYVEFRPTFAHICLDASGRTRSAHIHLYKAGSVLGL
jgi:UDP-2,3-diacylglucosamine pyrophosphatase LpxH